MAAADLTPVLPPTPHRALHPGVEGTATLIKDSFTLPTLLTLGALAQILLSLTLPAKLSLLPAGLLLIRAAAKTVYQLSSPGLLDMLPGKLSSQIPLPSYHPSVSSPFGSVPSSQGVVVFHLGVRFNSPLGPLVPEAKIMGDRETKK
ncbi:hypothetical protein QBC35DRAFT_463596 [Podospora australis]|uniref:Uncharacterized protein n=1 Tax=Podospora australis TaxID=1536484 RepID=A0AAN7AGH6_9PEZI|nr:hypothetical protein QBC35DRAFT_463596 [Podospora australis]